ncbi:oligosaccharide flippase family protein [Clostridium sp.]|jgi:O-antigen/teichoic acid export membrane protein|uniref:oligosaccharide flippase family protein n=1 Tax=Clostridium sp. TaxID=1506 RepID=UPI003EE9DEC6
MKKVVKSNVVTNYIYNSLYQVLTIIIPIITIPYVSRIFGAKGMGIYGYTFSVAQFFYIVGMFGISSYGIREIAYVRSDRKKTTKKFWDIWSLQVITSVCGLAIYMVFIIYFHLLDYKIAFAFQIPFLLNAMFDITWFFIAMEDFKKTVTRNIIVKIIGLILIFTFVKTSNDIYIYILINSSVVFLGSLTLWVFVKEYVGKFYIKNINIKHHINGAALILLPQFSIQMYTSLDKILIGKLSTIEQVGFYDQSQRIARIALAIVTSLSVVLMPRIASMYARSEVKKVEEYIVKSVNFTLASSIFIMSVIMGISKNFVPWFFGSEFNVIIIYMMISSLIILFIAVGGVFANQYTLPTNKNKEYIIPLLAASVINIALNLILVPKFKALGGVIAIVITEFVVCVLRIILVKKYLDIKKIFKGTYGYYLAGGLSAISVYISGYFILGGFLGLVIQGLVGLIVYTIILYIINNPIKTEIISIMKERKLSKVNKK